MTDERLRRAAALVGVALVAAIGVGAVVGSDAAADDLQRKAYTALSAHHLRGLSVDFIGREAKISGGSAAEMIKAKRIVERLNGVRWAQVTGKPIAGSVDAAAVGPFMKFSHSEIGATISGVVATAEDAADLKTAAAEAFGGTVSGDFAVDPSVGSADWIAAVPEVFGDVAGVTNVQIGVGGASEIQLGGSIESQVGADRVKTLVAAALPGFTVDSAITVDPGRLDSDDAAALNSATVYFDRGSAILTAAGAAALNLVADILNRDRGLAVEAGGHAGPTDPVKGRALSDARVAAVKAYLVGAGIEADRVTTKSYGSGAKTAADAFAEQYRRIDFAVKGN